MNNYWYLLIGGILAVFYLNSNKKIPSINSLNFLKNIEFGEYFWKVLNIIGFIILFIYIIPNLFPEEWSWFKDQDYFWPAVVGLSFSLIMFQYSYTEVEEENKNEKKNTDH